MEAVQVQMQCAHDADGAILVRHCETIANGVKHRITPDVPPRLEALLAGDGTEAFGNAMRASHRVTRMMEETLFAGQSVHGLTWIDGKVPMIKFRTDRHSLAVLLGTHFPVLEKPRTFATDLALRAYNAVLLPTLNLAVALRQLPAQGGEARLQAEARQLTARMAILKMLTDHCDGQARMSAEGEETTNGPVRSDALSVSGALERFCSEGGITMQLLRPSYAERFEVQSISLQRGGSRHKLIFFQPKVMEQAFGKRLGRLLESKLDLGERPIAIHAYPEFEYLEPGFATSNLHINMIESTRHLGTLSATLRLRRVHGVPQALQHFGPWPEGQHDRIGSPSAGSLRTHVSLAIDAAAVLVDRISTDEPAAINGSWLSFQEEYLWLLAKMVSRNLSMEREADWPSFAPAEGQRALPH